MVRARTEDHMHQMTTDPPRPLRGTIPNLQQAFLLYEQYQETNLASLTRVHDVAIFATFPLHLNVLLFNEVQNCFTYRHLTVSEMFHHC